MNLKPLIAASALALFGHCAIAGEVATGNPVPAWEDIKASVYAGKVIAEDAAVTLEAPYRATDDRTVPVTARASFSDGRTVKSLTLIIDENPMPVSAKFDLQRPLPQFGVSVNMRFNGPSTIRAIVEDSKGELHMAAAGVKTSGLGACAAPPVTDEAVALATLGEMEVTGPGVLDASGLIRPKPAEGQVRLDLKHPQHSGMQMNQITLLYIPARYLQALDVSDGSGPLFRMEGSISLSENPSIAFDVPQGHAGSLKVRMTDTDEAVFERVFPLGGA